MNILNVCLVSRDRTILTTKCIESIHQNSKNFNKINIYLFDNLSINIKERSNKFFDLLEKEKIVFYSYDTKISSSDCFPKAIAFRRFIEMMKLDAEIKNLKKGIDKKETTDIYYCLIDNDMILTEKWDEYFLSSIKFVKEHKTYKNSINYIVKHPGGVLSRNVKETINIQNIVNIKDTSKISLNFSFYGGSSGFWFMDYEMLLKNFWPSEYFDRVRGRYKRHDSTTWIKLKEKTKECFVVSVTPSRENPLVMHMGGIFGSMCIPLDFNNGKGELNYKSKISEMTNNEQILDKMSVSDIINMYKNDSKVLMW